MQLHIKLVLDGAEFNVSNISLKIDTFLFGSLIFGVKGKSVGKLSTIAVATKNLWLPKE